MTQIDEPCPFRRRIRKDDGRSGSEFPRESRHHDSAVQQRSGADRWLAFARPRLLTAALDVKFAAALTAALLGLLILPLATEGQQNQKTYHIGFLGSGPLAPPPQPRP